MEWSHGLEEHNLFMGEIFSAGKNINIEMVRAGLIKASHRANLRG